MMKKLLLILSLGLSLAFVAAGPMPKSYALFDSSKDAACQGISLGQSSDCTQGAGKIKTLLATVLNLFSLIVGVIAVIVLVIGGLKFITSQGEPGSTAAARNTIIYAVVGIVIVVLAQAIVRFVLSRTG